MQGWLQEQCNAGIINRIKFVSYVSGISSVFHIAFFLTSIHIIIHGHIYSFLRLVKRR